MQFTINAVLECRSEGHGDRWKDSRSNIRVWFSDFRWALYVMSVSEAGDLVRCKVGQDAGHTSVVGQTLS